MEAEERLLIEEAQKGDLASFEALVKKRVFSFYGERSYVT